MDAFLCLEKEKNEKTTPLIWIMPVSILVGVIAGYFILSENKFDLLNYSLVVSLILLYNGVSIRLGTNRKVFGNLKICLMLCKVNLF